MPTTGTQFPSGTFRSVLSLVRLDATPTRVLDNDARTSGPVRQPSRTEHQWDPDCLTGVLDTRTLATGPQPERVAPAEGAELPGPRPEFALSP